MQMPNRRGSQVNCEFTISKICSRHRSAVLNSLEGLTCLYRTVADCCQENQHIHFEKGGLQLATCHPVYNLLLNFFRCNTGLMEDSKSLVPVDSENAQDAHGSKWPVTPKAFLLHWGIETHGYE